MYNPSHFRVDSIQSLHGLIRQHPFGLLITAHEGELHTTHLPFHLEAARGAHGTLEAHVARVNPHCEALLSGANSVAVFRGPDAYISPRWYRDPTKNVPTWNYIAVHAHGRPLPMDDPARALRHIGTLTAEHEVYIDPPWTILEAQAHVERLVSHVLAFEIPIERFEGKWKLSQNRQPADRAGVLEGLRRSQRPDDRAMLEAMDALYTPDGLPR